MIRLRDVAEAAGVSVGTASKVLNTGTDLDRISPQCIERVRAAAGKLGYERNYHASSLQTGRADAIGVVLLPARNEGLGGSFWSPMVGGMDIEVRARGRHFVIVGRSENLGEVHNGLRFLDERRVDALIVPGYIAAGLGGVPALARSGAPIVLTEHEAQTSLPVVNLDAGTGIREAVKHLHELGHRELLWVGPAPDDALTAGRRDAFLAEAQARQVTTRDVFLVSASAARSDMMKAARQAVLDVSRDGFSHTAAVCFSEPVAFGVYAAAAELGLKIPADLSVVGFDDFQPDLALPPMTEVGHMLVDIGRRAVALAVEMIEDPDAWQRLRGHRETVPSRLSVRESTGPAPRR